MPTSLFFICFFSIVLSSHVNLAGAREIRGGSVVEERNPFTPKAALIRYWNKEIGGDSPKPVFLLSKASPLTAVESATFATLAAQNALHTRLPDLCSAAKLFCFRGLSVSLEKHDSDSTFAVYNDKNFTNYGSERRGGADSFKTYFDSFDKPTVGSFRRYSHSSDSHHEAFANYGGDASSGDYNDPSFNSYGAGSTGGSGRFNNYQDNVNIPSGRFISYSNSAKGRSQSFAGYGVDANVGTESFASYSKSGNEAPNDFSRYGEKSNLVESEFSGYGQTGNRGNGTFTNYGMDANVPTNLFKSYGDGEKAAVYSFKNYINESTSGLSSFQSYAKNSNTEKVNFVNYAPLDFITENFTSYGKGATGQQVGFKVYGTPSKFKEYSKKGITFSTYNNISSAENNAVTASGKAVNRWVESGKFFRESMLKEGTVMPMPDIMDKMPKRSFLPRNIVSKLPFSTSEIDKIKKVFGVDDDSSMAKIISDALNECERAPSVGETKRCVGSAEDMIDFATSVLGHHVAVRTTESVEGSNGQIMIGKVRGINGGRITESVSCHQSLYPYLLYYCHSVPKVRVYEADILGTKSRAKINHGIAICHLDTSAWSSDHGAFLALGPGPGRIEVCHWIFENDMTWTIAD